MPGDETQPPDPAKVSSPILAVAELPDVPEPPDSTAPRPPPPPPLSNDKQSVSDTGLRPNQVRTVMLNGVPIVALVIDGKERLCLAQISNTLLKNFSYNEIHNRRVALGITCVQCTPVQLEILRRAGAMPISSRRCGMITKREAERLCKSFLTENAPPKLPENFAFDVYHECSWGCRGNFIPSRYNSSRAKCIKCSYCNMFFSPNKFIFHSHRLPESKYTQPDAANFNSWRRHLKLSGDPLEETVHAWEDVKAMFNGGSRKRVMVASVNGGSRFQLIKRPRVGDSQSTPTSSVDKPPYLPVMPFPSKGYPGIPQAPPAYLPRAPPTTPLALTADKQLPAAPEIRQGFAEYMWGAGSGKQPPPPFPPSYGFVWPPRNPTASPAELSPTTAYFEAKAAAAGSKDLAKADADFSDSSRGNTVESDRASDLGTPTHRPLSSCSEHDQRTSDTDDSFGFRRVDKPPYQHHHHQSAFRPVIRGTSNSVVNPGGLLSTPHHPRSPSRSQEAPYQEDRRVTSTRTGDRDSVASSTQLVSSSDGENVDIEMTTDDERSVHQFPTIVTRPDSNCPDPQVPLGDPQASPPPALLPMVSPRLTNSKLVSPDDYQHSKQAPDNGRLSIPSPGERLSPGLDLSTTTTTSQLEIGKEKLSSLSEEDPRRLSALSKEELEEILLQETQARRRAEKEFQLMKGEQLLYEESFQEQVRREVAYREEIAKQLQLVRGRPTARSPVRATMDSVPRIIPGEEGTIRCVAEAQRSSRCLAPLFLQDASFAAMLGVQLQAHTTPMTAHPSLGPRVAVARHGLYACAAGNGPWNSCLLPASRVPPDDECNGKLAPGIPFNFAL